MNKGDIIKEDEHARRVRLYNSGVSLREVAETFGISIGAAHYSLRVMGAMSRAPGRRPNYTTDFAMLRTAVTERVSLEAIGAMHGVTGNSVFARFKRHGISIKNLDAVRALTPRQFEEYLSALRERIPHDDALEIALEY